MRRLRLLGRSLALLGITVAVGLSILGTFTNCALLPHHSFTEPSNDWPTRNGQLLYRTAKTTLIGEVFVSFSRRGDFELAFSKGPGVNLLTLKQNDSFAEVRGALARMGWSGAVEHAPKQLRGWLGLRDELMHAQNRHLIRHVSGKETFLFRF